MKKILKTFAGIMLMSISGLAIILDVIGNHGHLLFRPNMREDWIIFGVALLTGLSGLYLLLKNK